MAMLGPRLLIRVSRQSKICEPVGLNQIADDKEVRDFSEATSVETLTNPEARRHPRGRLAGP
jgi:hypothetical protein